MSSPRQTHVASLAAQTAAIVERTTVRMANPNKHASSIRYAICPHCRSEAKHGVRLCPGCEAVVTYGTPLILVIVTLAATAWLGFHAHRFFYDSWPLVALLAIVAAGGLLTLLSDAFDERVVFRKKRLRP